MDFIGTHICQKILQNIWEILDKSFNILYYLGKFDTYVIQYK